MLRGVFWAQCGLSFAGWVVYGLWLWRRHARRPAVPQGSSSRHGLIGTLLLFGGLGVLVLGGWAVESIGGIRDGLLTPAGWILVSITGFVFVHTQVFAAVRMASVALTSVTPGAQSASVNQEEGNQ